MSTPAAYVLGFGKYRGNELAAVYASDPQYVAWLAHTADRVSPAAKRAAAAFLREIEREDAAFVDTLKQAFLRLARSQERPGLSRRVRYLAGVAQRGYACFDLASHDLTQDFGDDEEWFAATITTRHPNAEREFTGEAWEDEEGVEEEWRTLYGTPLLAEQDIPDLQQAIWWPFLNQSDVLTTAPVTMAEALDSVAKALREKIGVLREVVQALWHGRRGSREQEKRKQHGSKNGRALGGKLWRSMVFCMASSRQRSMRWNTGRSENRLTPTGIRRRFAVRMRTRSWIGRRRRIMPPTWEFVAMRT